MTTLSSITHSRAFQKEPISFIGRASAWGWAKLMGRRTIDADSQKYDFTMRLPVSKQGYGSRGFFMMRDYYEPLLEILDSILKPGEVFFDCGANQGIFTLAAAKLVGEKGKVLSIEPQPYAVKCINENLKLNQLDNVTVTEAAVSDQKGRVTLDLSQSEVAASIVSDFGGSNTLEVETVTLDDMAEEIHTMPDVIKLDVEGAEYMALQGAIEVIDTSKPVLVLEVWDASDEHCSQFHELLQARGYHAHIIREARLLVVDELLTKEANVVYIHSDRLNNFNCIN
jgi:FkbM family methyltransferase